MLHLEELLFYVPIRMGNICNLRKSKIILPQFEGFKIHFMLFSFKFSFKRFLSRFPKLFPRAGKLKYITKPKISHLKFFDTAEKCSEHGAFSNKLTCNVQNITPIFYS